MPPDEDGERLGGGSIWQAEVEEDRHLALGKFESDGAHRAMSKSRGGMEVDRVHEMVRGTIE